MRNNRQAKGDALKKGSVIQSPKPTAASTRVAGLVKPRKSDHKIQQPSDVAAYWRANVESEPGRSYFAVIMLDANNCVKKHSVLLPNPEPRDILRLALLADADAVVLAENYPNGDPVPYNDVKAKPDRETFGVIHRTANLVRAAKHLGVKVYDHVIIGRTLNYSVAQDIGGLARLLMFELDYSTYISVCCSLYEPQKQQGAKRIQWIEDERRRRGYGKRSPRRVKPA